MDLSTREEYFLQEHFLEGGATFTSSNVNILNTEGIKPQRLTSEVKRGRNKTLSGRI